MIKDEKIDLKEFYEIRKDVLQTWPTGRSVSIERELNFTGQSRREGALPWS